MLNKKITIFAPDFKPMSGGVAEYTYHLARELNKLNLLDKVITTVHQEQKYSFLVAGLNKKQHDRHLGQRQGDSIFLGRKFNSIIYYFKLYLFVLVSFLRIALIHRQTFLLITYTDHIYARIVIKLCQLAKIDYGVCMHGLDLVKLAQNNRPYLNSICQYAKTTIFNSLATQKLFETLNIKTNNETYILYPGINTADCDRLASLSLTELEQRFKLSLSEKKIVLSVTRHIKRKGIDLAIKAIASLLSQHDDLIYLIAGEGRETDSYQRLIEEYQIGDRVILLGQISEVEKYSLLQVSSIFLMPNHKLDNTDFEGFGISFIEASYEQNAIVGGKSGGAVESVKENITGLLVDAEQEDAVAQITVAINKLLAEPSLLEQMSKQGKQYVVNNFLAGNLVKKFGEYLNQLLVKKANLIFNNKQIQS